MTSTVVQVAQTVNVLYNYRLDASIYMSCHIHVLSVVLCRRAFLGQMSRKHCTFQTMFLVVLPVV